MANTTYTVKDMQDSACPYYMHPNENPAVVLVQDLLTDKNYHTWSRAMRMSLLTKDKEGFIDGTIQEPDSNDPIHPYWKKCNTYVLRWLIQSMSPDIAQSVIWRDKASDVWAELKERLSHVNLFRISELQEEIYNFKQGDLSVTKYYTGMKILLDELDVLNPIPVCTCSANCTCGALNKLKNQRNIDSVVRFLKGLNEQYSAVRSQIMLMDPLPTINKVYSLIVQQERQFNVEYSGNSKVLVSASDNSHQDPRKYGNYKGESLGSSKIKYLEPIKLKPN